MLKLQHPETLTCEAGVTSNLPHSRHWHGTGRKDRQVSPKPRTLQRRCLIAATLILAQGFWRQGHILSFRAPLKGGASCRDCIENSLTELQAHGVEAALLGRLQTGQHREEQRMLLVDGHRGIRLPKAPSLDLWQRAPGLVAIIAGPTVSELVRRDNKRQLELHAGALQHGRILGVREVAKEGILLAVAGGMGQHS